MNIGRSRLHGSLAAVLLGRHRSGAGRILRLTSSLEILVVSIGRGQLFGFHPSQRRNAMSDQDDVQKLPEELGKPPLTDHLDTLTQIRTQDLEPDLDGGGTHIREGVAAERRVSIEDTEMRHGRKSKSKRFNGYKRHIATNLDTDLILACAVTPANRPEEEAAPILKADLER
jgi:hypothetical protein